MSLETINLNITEDEFNNAGYIPPVDEDNYEVSIYSIDFDTVKTGANKGKPRLKFRFKIVEGERTRDKNRGRSIFQDVNAFKGTSKETGEPTPPYDLLGIGKAIGLGLSDINNFNKGDWLGRTLRIGIEHEQKMKQNPTTKKYDTPIAGEFRAVVSRNSARSLDSVATSATANAGTSKKSKYSL